MINFFCKVEDIEDNAVEQLDLFNDKKEIHNVAVFPDIHYCTEKNLPVGVAFNTVDVFYPLVTGKDLGCGVMYLKFKKEDYIKPFDKKKHYNTFDRQSYTMTDDGLGGGNHFLSIEEGDDGYMYIICHTGSRNLGIELYQRFVKMVNDFNYKEGINDSYLPKEKMTEELLKYYNSILDFATNRRKEFVFKTLIMLQTNGYVNCDKKKIDKDYMHKSYKGMFVSGKLNSTEYKLQDSIHNHLRFGDMNIVHRKGSTELIKGEEVIIPLSMTRGSLIVKHNNNEMLLGKANYSCSHGAGRKLSRTDTLKHWNSGMKASERKTYMKNFFELLDKQGKFPKGYIQEFDFAYKTSDDILKLQPYITKVATTTPIATVKFTEI
jgi:tRNA-splicing ligase RtcB/release factor H-coupled RctB family protein